ncbi:MAG: hypothetical protein Q4G42_09205 [Neisseria sp.]|nr:hypothetical protein [Neisseria sp.]
MMFFRQKKSPAGINARGLGVKTNIIKGFMPLRYGGKVALMIKLSGSLKNKVRHYLTKNRRIKRLCALQNFA